jgi:hypothetical protein
MKNKKKDFITIEDSKVFIHTGSSKIDATMAFKIGLAVGSGSIEGVEYLKISK